MDDQLVLQREEDGHWSGEAPDLPCVPVDRADRAGALARVQPLALLGLAERLAPGEAAGSRGWRMRGPVSVLVLLASPVVLPAEAQVNAPSAPDTAAYRELARQLEDGDTLIDFGRLRFLFAEQPGPDPAPDVPSLLERAAAAPDHETARTLLDSALVHHYGNVRAHEDAARLFTKRGDTVRARFHEAAVRGFIRSMVASAAQRPDASIPVISIQEEYAFLRSRGLERVHQALASCGDYLCDIIVARDPATGEEQIFRFLLTWWPEQ